MKYDIAAIKEAIATVKDPSRTQRQLGDLDAIKHIGIDQEQETVTLLIEVGKNQKDVTSVITRQIAKIIKGDLGFKGMVIDYEQKRPEALSKTVKIIGVVSGKGGVGKSSVTANLAFALKRLGKKVGIIDADIYGANMPMILGAIKAELRADANEKIYPVMIDGIEMVSTEYFVEENRALMWRGPMLNKVLEIFFTNTLWSQELDYLLIDFPPGTGDVMMDVKNFVPDIKVVLVTTPHPNASHIAIKAGFAARSLNQDLIGVIENMSYYEIDGVRHDIFGRGGGQIVADKLVVPLLGEIPIAVPEGLSDTIFQETEKTGVIYLQLAKNVMSAYDQS
ncbi:MAG: P-loop NTPase [Candidatus Izemoplasmatales bacterium]|nr:P-loop NTPase [Candidatus Izemoplasmatales bacterium]